jgi:beta-glucosidase
MEWEFGAGLSYTTFEYSDLTISDDTVSEEDTLDVSVTVTNTGPTYTADHTVMLFQYDMYRRVTPEYKLLKR